MFASKLAAIITALCCASLFVIRTFESPFFIRYIFIMSMRWLSKNRTLDSLTVYGVFVVVVVVLVFCFVVFVLLL